MPQPKQMPATKRPNSNVSEHLARIEASALPWWSKAPAVAANCVKLAFFPIKAIAVTANAIVSLAFVGLGGVAVMWWYGLISDAAVSGFLGKLGDRALSIVRSSGLI